MHNYMQAVCEGDSSAVNFRRARKERAARAEIRGEQSGVQVSPNGWFNERAADTPPFTYRFPLSNSKPETDGD